MVPLDEIAHLSARADDIPPAASFCSVTVTGCGNTNGFINLCTAGNAVHVATYSCDGTEEVTLDPVINGQNNLKTELTGQILKFTGVGMTVTNCTETVWPSGTAYVIDSCFFSRPTPAVSPIRIAPR